MSDYVTEIVTEPLTKTFIFNSGRKVVKDTCFISRDEAFTRILNECLIKGINFSLSNRLRNYELEYKLEEVFPQNAFVINTICPFNGW